MLDQISKKIIHSIQNEYFELVEEHFGNIYTDYKNSEKELDYYISSYVANIPTPLRDITGKALYSHSSLPQKILDFTEKINYFWEKNITKLAAEISKSTSVGFFGTVENNQTLLYETTIKQNAVFFDVVALNDPFSSLRMPSLSTVANNGVLLLFLKSVIAVISIKKYVLHNDDMMAIIVPTEVLIDPQILVRIDDKTKISAIEAAKKQFGLDYEETDLYDNMRILKGLSDQDISKMFMSSGIYLNFFEARRFEEYATSIDTRREIINLSKSETGIVNRDFIRCLYNYSTIFDVLADTFYVHALHTEAAQALGMHPIYNVFEWFPNKFYYEHIPGAINPSDEYKYVCAVQHSKELAQIVQLNMSELLKFREKNESEKFRELFRTATDSIVSSPDQFEEIAQLVFSRLKETLCSTTKERKTTQNKKFTSSVIGLGKSALGFVPIVSHVLGVVDLLSSFIDVLSSRRQEEDVINHLINCTDNILRKKK